MVSRMYIYFQEETYLKADIEYSSGKIIFQSLTEMMKTYIERLTTDLVHPSTANVQQTSSTTPDLLLTISFTIEKVMNSQASLEKIDLLQHINRFYDIQGKAERIKNTPFLKIYSAFTRIIVVTYVILIPFFLGDIDLGGEHSHWEYLAVPIMAAISTLFLTINHLANRYGEPFTAKMTSIPVVAIKNKIIAYITNVQLLNN